MRAAVMYGREDIRVEEVAVPEPRQGELLLSIRTSGVCGTDMNEFFYGPYLFPIEDEYPHTDHHGPMIPGHEFGGRVVAMGPGVEGFSVGDLVASGAGVSCGTCFQCRSGRTNLCVEYWTVGLQRHGALAEYAAVPALACREVGSHGVTDDAAAIVQPMSIGVHAMRRGRPVTDEDHVVIGVGGVGAFLTYALTAGGHRVVATDLDQDRLDLAARSGADVTIVSGPDLTSDLRDAAPQARVVYEVSGSAVGLAAALDTVVPGGRVVIVGHQKQPASLDLKAITIAEVDLIGTNAHAFAADFDDAIRMVADRPGGWLDVAPTALPLEALATEVLPAMQHGTTGRIKTLFDPTATRERATEL